VEARADPLQVVSILERMIDWGWVRRLDEEAGQGSSKDGAPRFVLMADPAVTPAQPLLEALLAAPSATLTPLQQRWSWSQLTLRDVLG
jgi:membrane protein